VAHCNLEKTNPMLIAPGWQKKRKKRNSPKARDGTSAVGSQTRSEAQGEIFSVCRLPPPNLLELRLPCSIVVVFVCGPSDTLCKQSDGQVHGI
jgi:hypothetical protein